MTKRIEFLIWVGIIAICAFVIGIKVAYNTISANVYEAYEKGEITGNSLLMKYYPKL